MEAVYRPPTRLQGPHVVLLLATVTLVVFTFTKHRVGTNVQSRLISVERLLEAGTLIHDDTPFAKSVDAVSVDGHVYSSKSPTSYLLAALTAWPVRMITGASVYEYQRLYLQWIVLTNQVLPYIVVLWLAWWWVRRRTDSPWTQTMFLLGMSFACLPFGYAVTLNNHTPAAICLFLMWLLSQSIENGGWKQPHRGAFLAGACGGLAASFEPTAGIFTPLFAVVLGRREWQRGLLLVTGAALACIPMLATYHLISGSIVPFYIRPELYLYPGSYWNTPAGFDALAEPRWQYIFNALLGHHGLFSLTPYVAVGLTGLFWQARKREGLSMAVLAGAAVVMTYILSTTNNYGGRALGMRWFAQFMPLFAVGALPVLQWIQPRPGWRRGVYGLFAVSAIIVVEALVHNTFSPGGWVYGLQKVLG